MMAMKMRRGEWVTARLGMRRGEWVRRSDVLTPRRQEGRPAGESDSAVRSLHCGRQLEPKWLLEQREPHGQRRHHPRQIQNPAPALLASNGGVPASRIVKPTLQISWRRHPAWSGALCVSKHVRNLLRRNRETMAACLLQPARRMGARMVKDLLARAYPPALTPNR